MRAIGHISHTIAARVLLAGAALLTGASVATARPVEGGFNPGDGNQRAANGDSSGTMRGARLDPLHPGEEVALAVPRLSLREGGGDDAVTLPRPLSPDMATLVRSIFRLQRQGAFAEALSSTTRLTDTTLLADVLAERFVNPAYHPTAAELRRWLHDHADMADAPAIFSRLSLLPDHGPLPAAPSTAMLGGLGATADSNGATSRPLVRNVLLDRTVQERATLGVKGAQSALHLIAITPGMTPPYAAQLGGEVAQLLLSQGEFTEALRVAEEAFHRGEGQIGLPAYIAGLAAWSLDRKAEAASLFEHAASASFATPELISAASFWAARSHRASGGEAAYRPWLQRALAAPTSFYGQLAHRLLGHRSPHPAHHGAIQTAMLEIPLDDTPSQPVLTEIDIEAVEATPIGRQLFALLQVGEQERAEKTLRRYWPHLANDAALARSLQLVAEAAGLNDLALEMADAIQGMTQASDRRSEQLPLPNLHPRHGFTVDPALVYALTRLESNFNPGAVSEAGAHGLMQLRPITAGFVTGKADRFTASPQALHDPGLNLEIGQSYVRYLAHLTSMTAGSAPPGGDLIRLLASYNAGPGAIGHWESGSGASSDPLLYMERLPNPQTRAYVSQAFSYLWTYAAHMNLPTPSLEALAEGEWPDFANELMLATSSWHEQTIH